MSELYRPSDSRLSAKLVPTFADRGCHMVSVTDPYSRLSRPGNPQFSDRKQKSGHELQMRARQTDWPTDRRS
jgi:hypothetical protein